MNQHTSRLMIAISFAIGFPGSLSAATPLPAWFGEPDTTRQGYLFQDDDLTPAPEILDNPFGTPSALVTTGVASDGWQDPGVSYDLSGVDNDGAWDLGVSGSARIDVPFAPSDAAPGITYKVEFEIYAVAYFGITALPSLDMLGLSPSNLTLSQSTVAVDSQFPGASWQALRWTGFFENLTSDSFAFAIVAPSNNISVIDTVEVFTRLTVVPEPSGVLLVTCPAVMWVLRRRRS